MFGTLRYVLALVVLVDHLTQAPHIGGYAVYVFFMLSGYLMTHVLNNVYSQNITGYIVNRILRIYPTYIAAVLLTLTAAALIPNFWMITSPDKIIIPTGSELITSLLIPNWHILLPAWTLKVEIFYYLVMPLIALSLSRVKVWLWVSIGLAILIPVLEELRVLHSYGRILPASIAFSFGAWLWHIRIERTVNVNRIWILGSLLTSSFIVPLLYPEIPKYLQWVTMLITAGIGGLLVIELSYLKNRFKKIDDFLGDVSYPIYLLHITAGSLFVSMGSIGIIVFGTITAHLVSVVIVRFIEEPIQALRRRMRDYRRMPEAVVAS